MAFAPPGFTRDYSTIVTLWLALDRVTEHNGCLEFMPGSHRMGLLTHIGDRERTAGEPPLPGAVEPHVDMTATFTDVSSASMPLDAGSAVIFDGFVLHRSAANRSSAPRKAVSFVYALPAAG